MAHFARLDDNNMVLETIVVANGDILDENGNESEEKGIDFCKNLFGQGTKWIQTSFTNSFRKRFAGEGARYIPETDIFAMPQPFPSWTYNVNEDVWEAPVSRPEDGENYTWFWNEETQTWNPNYFISP